MTRRQISSYYTDQVYVPKKYIKPLVKTLEEAEAFLNTRASGTLKMHRYLIPMVIRRAKNAETPKILLGNLGKFDIYSGEEPGTVVFNYKERRDVFVC